MSSRISRWKLRPELMHRPTVRHAAGPADEGKVSWLELFYDLAFVAVIGTVGHVLVKPDSDYRILGQFLLFFIPVWWAWVGQAFYLSRFQHDALSSRVTTLAQIMVLVVMATSVAPAVKGETALFAGCYAALRVILIGQYLYTAWHVPESRPLTTRYAAGFSVAAGLWIISTFVPAPVTYGLWLTALLIDFFTPFTAGVHNVRIPPHAAHIPERFGLFTIIVLGEEVLAAMRGLSEAVWTPVNLAMAALGLVLAFSVWWIYFEGVRGADHVRLNSSSVSNFRRWLYSHLPLHLGIVVMAMGFERFLLKEKPPIEARIEFAVAIAVIAVCMHLLFNTRNDRSYRKEFHWYTRPHNVLTWGMVLAVPLAWVLPPLPLMALYTGAFVGHVVLTWRMSPEAQMAAVRQEVDAAQAASTSVTHP